MKRLTRLICLLLLALGLAGCRRAPGPVATALPIPAAAGPMALATRVPPSPQPGGGHDGLYLPLVTEGGATATPAVATASPEPTATATPAYPVYNGPPLERARLGVQIHLHREDLGAIMGHLQALEVGWVKVQVSWKLFQPEPDRLDDFLFGELDRLVAAADAVGIAVLLGVAKAPEWSRPTTELDGPPLDGARFEAFMALLAGRYRERVAAYELWNEGNLQREWHGAPLGGAGQVALIRAGAAGVRAADPAAIIISGAPAPTGINDGLMAVDDRFFLRQMVAAGLLEIVAGVGVHPYGWANAPDASMDMPGSAAGHNDHPSFFFADTLGDYRAILEAAGRPEMPLWATELGWGSFDGFGAPPPAGAEFMAGVSEWQQAAYTLRALELAQGQPWLGPLILWNLNFAPTFGSGFSESGYSLLRPDGSPRPVYLALQAAPRR